MDIIDKVTYDFEWDNEKDLSEETRRAFVNLFDPTNNDALLVIKHLTAICKWQDMTEYNDPVIEAKMNALRNVIVNIKNQINMKPIEEDTYE
jgi:fibrillarin-like rRNA methylase